MTLKPHKGNIKILLLVLVVLALSLFTLNKQKITILLHDGSEWIMSQDLGFSTLGNLSDTGDGDFLIGGYTQPITEKIASLIKSIPKIIEYKFSNQSDQIFERVDIDIKFIDYKKILEDRKSAIESGQLFNPRMVRAEIKFQNKIYKSKIRLKGDLSGHWLSGRRISLRIKLKDKGAILGFREFGLQKPRERQFPYDYTYQSLVKESGNISSAQNFVHLYINGNDWGIMNIEEHVTKEFLEKQKRKESIIVRFSEEEATWPNNFVENPYWLHRLYDSSLHARLYKDKKYLKDDQSRLIFSYISKKHLAFDSELYDIDSMMTAYILAMSWGHAHTLRDNNTRYYFNPYTLKLEPITTDQFRYEALNGSNNITNWPVPPQFYSVISTQAYADNLPKYLLKVKGIVNNVQKHLNKASHLFPLDKKKNGNIVLENMNKLMLNKKEYLIFPPNKYSTKPFVFLKEQIEQLSTGAIIPTQEQASRFNDHLHVRHYRNGTVELYNLIPDDVIVEDITFKGESIIDNTFTVPSYLASTSPYVIKTKVSGIQDNKIIVHTKYKNFHKQTNNKITLLSETKNPLLRNDTQENEFLEKLKNGDYQFKKGNWIIKKPIIVNGNLHIERGTNIKFSNDSYLIVKGALIAIGSEDKPIILSSLANSWKGVYVLNATKESYLNNVIINNINALQDGLLKLTGGITFYKSNVNLKNVSIDNVLAEDALNIIESKFNIDSISINNTRSDGLDSDFSVGIISESKFLNIGGDALDFSGSNVDIYKVNAEYIKDKSISAGEASIIDINEANFNQVGVGIASKDGSKVSTKNCTITNYQLYAAMSYTKKEFYTSPSLSLHNCNVEQGDAYMRQDGSYMSVNNVEIKEANLNVKKLYERGFMKK
jgi:hypothetical protein